MGKQAAVSARGVWAVTIVLAVVAFWLGYVGFDGYVRGQDDFRSADPADLVYYTLQLFVLDPTPFGSGHINLPLQIARFLAPVTTVLALVQTLALLFGDWATAFYARWKPGHVIVIGDGHAGALLAERLLRRGEVVVVLGGAVPPENVRGRRMLVLPGEPTEELTLRAAGLGRASAVYAMSSSSMSNAAVALAVSKWGGPTVCVYAHVADDVLVAAVRARHPVMARASWLPEFVSLDAVAARVLLDEHPPGYVNGRPRPVVITGTGAFPLALLRELGRRQEQTRVRRQVSVVTEGLVAESALAPDLAQLDIDWVPSVPDDGDATVYVCWADPDRALRTGLAQRPAGTGRVVLCLQRLAGLGEALNGQRVFDAERITVFGILDTACDPQRLERDLLDQLARAVHAHYVKNRLDEGAPAGDTVVPWEELEQRFRADNRRVAADVQNKLAVIGAELMPLGRAFAPFCYEGSEVIDLARREHDRWMAAKVADGFVYGPDRTDTTHPDIRPWDQLTAHTQQKDVEIVESLPAVLAEAGLQIVRRRDLRDAPPTRPQPRTHRWGLGAFLLVEAIFLAVSALIGAAVLGDGTPSVGGITVALLVPTVLAAGTALLVTRLRGNGPRVDLGLRWSWREVGLGLGFGFGGLALTAVAGAVYVWIVGPDASSAVGDIFDGQRSGLLAALLIGVIVVVIAPVCEEIIYRGLLWGALEKLGAGPWIAFAVTTVVFALAHFELTRAPLLLVIAIPIGLARVVTGRLLASIVAHQVNNLLPGVALVLGLLGVLPL